MLNLVQADRPPVARDRLAACYLNSVCEVIIARLDLLRFFKINFFAAVSSTGTPWRSQNSLASYRFDP
jgi:hypothetical protein